MPPKMPVRVPYRQAATYLDEDTYNKLNSLAIKNNLSLSTQLRQIICEVLKIKNPAKNVVRT